MLNICHEEQRNALIFRNTINWTMIAWSPFLQSHALPISALALQFEWSNFKLRQYDKITSRMVYFFKEINIILQKFSVSQFSVLQASFKKKL